MSVEAVPGPTISAGGRWHALGVTAEGQFVPLPLYSIDANPSARTMLDASSALADPNVERVMGTAIAHLQPPGTDGAIPGVDSITDWAGAAVFGELPGLPGRVQPLPLPGEATGLAFLPFDGSLGCAAWHDDSCAAVAVPPGLNEVLVSCREDGGAALRREAAAALLTSRTGPGHSPGVAGDAQHQMDFETDLEWFGFLGTGTDAVHGSDHLVQSAGDRSSGTIRLETGGRPGTFLLRPWQWLGKPIQTPRTDPMFQDRLAAHLRHVGHLADEHPELGDAKDGSLDGPLVWVHGTVSCGLAAIPQLERLGGPWYRYEHDTFHDIDQNGRALAALLDEKLSPEASCASLVAHSRGGLVVRAAAAELRGSRRPLDLQVLTLGTPHCGTPIVNAGHRALRAFVAATSFGGNALPHPGTMLLKYLLRPVALPDGIKDMGTGSRFLSGFNANPQDPFTLESFGADYQRGAATETAGVKTLGRLRPLFEAAGTPENDLVVPRASATARGRAHMLKDSRTHFAYLEDPEVQRSIRVAISHMKQVRHRTDHAGQQASLPESPPKEMPPELRKAIRQLRSKSPRFET